MRQGPFKSEKADRAFREFFQSELNPLLTRIRALAIGASSLRVGFWQSFTRGRLRQLEGSYVTALTDFMGLYSRWSDLDSFFESVELNDNERGLAVTDYSK